MILLLSCSIFACDTAGNPEHEEFGSTSGGSGEVVNFIFDCDFDDVDCPGAKKERDSWGDGVKEVKCAWGCALNTTEYKDPKFVDRTGPARYVLTFRKVGDNCWRVQDVDRDKCGKDLNRP